jgi:hypothetical protein
MKPNCEVKCEWKDWHDKRVAKWKEWGMNALGIFVLLLVGAMIFFAGYGFGKHSMDDEIAALEGELEGLKMSASQYFVHTQPQVAHDIRDFWHRDWNGRWYLEDIRERMDNITNQSEAK